MLAKEAMLDMFAYGDVMNRLSRELSVEPGRLPARSLGPVELGNRIEKKISYTRGYLDNWAEAARAMVREAERKGEDDETMVMGPVVTTGVGDTVSALTLMPIPQRLFLHDIAESGAKKQAVRAAEVLVGTPSLVSINDPKLAQELDGMNRIEREAAMLQAMKEKAAKSATGEERAHMVWGGWGNHERMFINRHGWMLNYALEEGEVPIGMVVQPAFFGASYTLKRLSEEARREVWGGLSLRMFTAQMESYFKQISKVLIPEWEPVDSFKHIFDVLAGHSMGAYLLLALSRPGTGLSAVEAFKEMGGKVMAADKPLIVGARVSEARMPEWVRETVHEPGYRSHVPLQSDFQSRLVRAGAWRMWSEMGLGDLREAVIMGDLGGGVVERTFAHYMTPEMAFDGKNLLRAHMHNYAQDELYHRLCIHLLDWADPIMTDPTILEARSGQLGFLRMLFGEADATLRHQLGERLSLYLGVATKNINWDEDGVHYANLMELMWMMGIKGRERVG